MNLTEQYPKLTQVERRTLVKIWNNYYKESQITFGMLAFVDIVKMCRALDWETQKTRRFRPSPDRKRYWIINEDERLAYEVAEKCLSQFRASMDDATWTAEVIDKMSRITN